MAPSFSVVLIAKNESKTLPRLLESLKEFRSKGGEVVVVDTGSTDDTHGVAFVHGCRVEIASDRFSKSVGNMALRINRRFVVKGEEPIAFTNDRVFDYSAARNYAAEQASNDWVFMPDCDEMLTAFDLDVIERTLSIPELSRLEYQFVYNHKEDGSPNTAFKHSKFYRRDRMHWQGVVHEVLQVYSGSDVPMYLPPEAIYLEHYQNAETDRGHYLKGLALDCQENPTHDRNSHYFGRELLYSKRYRSAIEELKRHIAMYKWAPERAQSMIFIGDCYKSLGDTDEALTWYHKAIGVDGSRREAWMRLADYYYNLKDAQRTVSYALAATTIPLSDYYANNRAEYEHLPHEMLYWGLWWLGDKEGSYEHWKKCLEYQPTNPKYLGDAEFYADFNKSVSYFFDGDNYGLLDPYKKGDSMASKEEDTLTLLGLEVVAECMRAHAKHGNESMMVSGVDSGKALGILTEEIGEVAEEVLAPFLNPLTRMTDMTGHLGRVARATTYDNASTDELRKELVQVAAMSLSWIYALDTRPKNEV